MKKMIMLILALLLFCAGCFPSIRPQATPLAFDRNLMEMRGQVEGESTEIYLLSILPLSEIYNTAAAWGYQSPNLRAATKNALAGRDADQILNPSVDVSDDLYFFGLWRSVTVKVSGLAVKVKKGD